MTEEKKVDYQALSQELEAIVDRLQGDDIDIDAGIAMYERGLEIVKQLEAYLKTAENQVTKLQAKFESGKA